MTAWSVYVYYTAYVHSLCYIVTCFVFSYEHLKSYYTARIPITYLAVALSTATNDYDSLPGTVGEEVKSKTCPVPNTLPASFPGSTSQSSVHVWEVEPGNEARCYNDVSNSHSHR